MAGMPELNTIICGSCRSVMADWPACSIDSIVTDPPYGLEFMGKEWDKLDGDGWRTGAGMSKPGIGERNTEWPSFGGGDSANATCAVCGGRMRGAKRCSCDEPDWRVKGELLAHRNNRADVGKKMQDWHYHWAVEALRVGKPGAFLLAFGGTRTFHRLACAIEDAGWEIRDCVGWIYGQGFPKGQDVAWEMHKRACVSCGFMVEYVHDNKPATRGIQEAEYNLRFVRATYLQTPIYACAKCGQVLQPFMSEQEAQALRAAWSQSEAIWPEESSVEGWGDVEASQGQLRRCPVCQMSHGILADGAQGWLHHGASSGNGSIPWQTANADGSRPSYRPQAVQQLHQQSDAFLLERTAQAYRGYNVALKPAWEPIIVARKPLEGTVAQNVIKWGTGALNIDGCRIPASDKAWGSGNRDSWREAEGRTDRQEHRYGEGDKSPSQRWPANLIHDGSEEVVGLFPHTGPASGGAYGKSAGTNEGWKRPSHVNYVTAKPGTYAVDNGGSAARFFYCSKAPRSQRWFWCQICQIADSDREQHRNHAMHCHDCGVDYAQEQTAESGTERLNQNNLIAGFRPNTYSGKNQHKGHKVEPNIIGHPTQKPEALMRYLCRLVTPPAGIVLDCFAGSGSTLIAARDEGFQYIGIESEEEYCRIARERLAADRGQIPVAEARMGKQALFEAVA